MALGQHTTGTSNNSSSAATTASSTPPVFTSHAAPPRVQPKPLIARNEPGIVPNVAQKRPFEFLSCQRCGTVFCSVKCQREEWPTHRPLCSGYTSASIGAALQDTQQQQQHIEGDTTETKLIRAKSTLANTEAKLRDLNKELEALDDAERAKTNAETLDQNAKSEAEAAQQRLAAARTAFARAQSNLAAAEAAVAKANAAATNLPLFVEQQRAQFAADRTKLRDSIRATNERVLATKNRVAKLEKALKEEPDGRASMKKPRKPAAVPSSSAPSSSSSSTVLLPPPPLPRTNNVPTAEDEAAMTLMGDHEELERKRRMAEMYARLSEASSSNHAFGDIQPADNDELSRY